MTNSWREVSIWTLTIERSETHKRSAMTGSGRRPSSFQWLHAIVLLFIVVLGASCRCKSLQDDQAARAQFSDQRCLETMRRLVAEDGSCFKSCGAHETYRIMAVPCYPVRGVDTSTSAAGP